MYAVFDGKKPIAFHEEKSVVKNYIEGIFKNHGISLEYYKVDKKILSKYKDYHDLYLQRYGSIYIQSKYILYTELSTSQCIEDLKFTKDILKRTLELTQLTEKEQKHMVKVIEIINNQIYDTIYYVPSFDELHNLKLYYDEQQEAYNRFD